MCSVPAVGTLISLRAVNTYTMSEQCFIVKYSAFQQQASPGHFRLSSSTSEGKKAEPLMAFMLGRYLHIVFFRGNNLSGTRERGVSKGTPEHKNMV